MARVKQQAVLTTRLAQADDARFREMAVSQKLSQTELLRKAALFFMDNYERVKQEEMETVYSTQLRSSTNRICGLMAKVGLEVHTIVEFFRRMDGGDELIRDCMSVAAKRLDKGLDKEASRIKDQMKKVIES